ncbi:MAG: GlcNAc-PI de-N-acetylase [Chloroflexi bacterium]|nr:GlcNAc-PI de-N-acetylase [Chloroflexota bacterium]
MENNTNPKKTLLAVFAHPDDESFGIGGTLALYASQGVDVHLVCATKGEVGDVAPEFMEGYASIAEVRTAELYCAAENLGISEVHFLGYRDSGMPGSGNNSHPQSLVSAPLEEVAAKVVGYIRELRPQVVITFDPHGGYFHPDHIAIQKAALQAFHAAGDESQFPGDLPAFQPQSLYYMVFPRGFLRFAVRLWRLIGKDPTKFGRNKDIDLEKMAGAQDFPIHAVINYRSVAASKIAADECHASQFDMGPSNPLMTLFRRLSSGKDNFMRAHPPVTGKRKLKDLFAD